MQGRGADHAVRESCDRARTGRGTASRRSTSESPPSDEGQVKDQAERQRGFDGNLGVLQLPSALADAHGLPRGDRFRRQPQGDVASLDQCSVVRRPVSDAVFRFVPGMHSRLHVEIMPLRPSRWPGPRRTLVTAHQRHVYHDFASGVSDDRPGLDSCGRALWTGDVLVVWKLDRLGRTLAHLVNTVQGSAALGCIKGPSVASKTEIPV